MDTANAADVIYAPILKWKEGEQLALRDLRIPIDDMRPVIELVPTRRPSEPKPRKGHAEPPPQRSMEMLTDQAIGKAMDAIARTRALRQKHLYAGSQLFVHHSVADQHEVRR